MLIAWHPFPDLSLFTRIESANYHLANSFFLSQTVVVHGWKKKKKSAEELKLGLWPFRGAVAALPEVMVGFFACVSWAKREEQMVPLRSSCRHKRENDDSMTLAYR